MNHSVAADHSVEALISQVADEYVQRLERGEQPHVEEYATRYPQIAATLRQVLPALQLLRQPGSGDADSAAGIEPEGPLGDYRIVREIGRGGMGVVYEAVQISLGRRVALKVLPFAAALDAKQLQRFKNEAQAAAHLHHTNIVPVHAVGCERGVHYYAMQYIEGSTLAALIWELRQRDGERGASDLGRAGNGEAVDSRVRVCEKMGTGSGHDSQNIQISDGWPVPVPIFSQTLTGSYSPPEPAVAAQGTGFSETQRSAIAAVSTEGSTKSPTFFRTVANLGVQAAEALEHAHGLGVIHRDIKPANLLIDMSGNVWITDFGLARLGSDAGLTMTGDLLGTIRYMSPEQALAQRVPLDARTDVYSLGVTLYELLTLEPAYNGRNREEVLRQIAFEEPRSPRHLNKAVPVELETIVLKAMAKNPEERYLTARELADDLRRFLEDKPIRARRPSLRQRAIKWTRRHKTVVRAVYVVLALTVVGLAAGTVFVWRANDELRQALERERQNAYFQRVALADREWSANNLGRMQQLLDDCPEDLRGWEWHYLKRLPHSRFPLLHHQSAVLSAAFSPDGRQIASCSQDGFVKVWDAKTGQELRSFQAHEDHARHLAFSPDSRRLATGNWGRRLATGGWGATIKVWDIYNGHLIHTLTKAQGAQSGGSVAFSPDGRHLACGGGEPDKFGDVTIWDAAAGQELLTLSGHTLPVLDVAFSPDGRQLASASVDGTVKVWEMDWPARTGRERMTLPGHRLKVYSVAFSPDGRRLASASADWVSKADGEVKVWDMPSGAELVTLRGHIASILSVRFSPDGHRLASAGADQTVKIWDVLTGQEALTLRGHLNWVRSVAFSPDGTRLVTAGDDRTVHVWDARPISEEAGREVRTLRGHRAGVRGVAFHPSGRYLASAGDDGIVKIWDSLTGAELRTLPTRAGMVARVQFSNRGDRLALLSDGRGLKVYDTGTWQECLAFAGTGAVSFSRDDRYVASGGGEFTVKVWDAATGHELRSFHDHNWPILNTAWHPDGRWVASAGYDGAVRLWDVSTGEEMPVSPLRHAGGATSVAFSPDGRCLASGGLDRAVRIWDTAVWCELRSIHDPTGGVQSVTWSPDGRQVLWGGMDGTLKMADPATGAVVQTMRGHTSWVESVVFSRDGHWIASASLDGTVKIWPAPAGLGTPDVAGQKIGKRP
jgi:WD40 repeat protein/serine/threonine protein kinase